MAYSKTLLFFIIGLLLISSKDAKGVHKISNVDSLEYKLKSMPNDSRKSNLCINYAQNLSKDNSEAAIRLCKKGIALANKLGLKETNAKGIQLLARIYTETNQYQTAINYYLISAKLQEELQNQHELIHIYNNLGKIYFRNHYDNQIALEYFQKALTHSLTIEDKNLTGDSYNLMGMVYMELDDVRQAKLYFEKTYTIREELKDSIGMASSLNNFGEIERKKGNLNKAKDYYQQSLDIHQRFRKTLNQ